MKISNTRRGVCVGVTPDSVFMVYNGCLQKLTPDLLEVLNFVRIPVPVIDADYGLLRLLSRPLRRGVISGVVGRSLLMIWTRRQLFLFCKETLDLKGSWPLEGIGRPLLVLATMHDGQDAFYFGEYFSNPNQRAVSILRLTADGLDQIGQIPAQEVEHVHNIQEDDNGDLIILAGDFGDAASIWRLGKLDWNPICIARGDQNYRTSAAIQLDGTLIYATDTTSKTNSLRRLDLKTGIEAQIAMLPASSIYGVTHDEELFFSTNLEAALETKDNFFRKWLTQQLPKCFTTDKVHVMKVSNGTLTEILSVRSSWLPFRLFQYPTFRLHVSPYGIYASGTSVRGADHKVLLLGHRSC